MSDKITVKVDNVEREIFMSFGLLTVLCNIAENPVRTVAVTVDKDLRDRFLGELLAKRKPSGKVTEAVADLDDIDISVEDAEKLLQWAAKGVLDFFLRNMKVANDLLMKNEDLIKALQSSQDGSQGLALPQA